MRAGCGAQGRIRPCWPTSRGPFAWAAVSACWARCCVSAAIEFKAEGRVLGTGAKMFTIAGPVIVYGTLAAVVYGAVLWLKGLLPV